MNSSAVRSSILQTGSEQEILQKTAQFNLIFEKIKNDFCSSSFDEKKNNLYQLLESVATNFSEEKTESESPYIYLQSQSQLIKIYMQSFNDSVVETVPISWEKSVKIIQESEALLMHCMNAVSSIKVKELLRLYAVSHLTELANIYLQKKKYKLR